MVIVDGLKDGIAGSGRPQSGRGSPGRGWLARTVGSVLVALALLAGLGTTARAAGPALTVEKIDASAFPQVQANAVVTDGGSPATGLPQSAFSLLEDDQTVASFQVQPSTNPAQPGYLLTYTSKLAADGQPHFLTVRVTVNGSLAEGKGSFTARAASSPSALGLQVQGLRSGAAVSGVALISAVVTGGTATQVQLLVDGQPQVSASQPPFTLQWDTSKVAPGAHTVTIQASDPQGRTVAQTFSVQVTATAAAPTAAPAPTTAPVATAAAATPVPAAAAPAAPTGTNPLLYVVGAVIAVALVAIGALVALLLSRRRPRGPVPAPPPPAPVPSPPKLPPLPRSSGGDTEVIRAPSSPVPDEATMVAGAGTLVSAAATPRGRLRVRQGDTESEVALTTPETIIGREATNPVVVRDPLASRRHARITWENGAFWVEDLKSLNGTRVNGESLTTRRPLARNDQITIGEVVLTFSPD
jgi:pSer/pThr/pTyr-binding forkhead associated (FHA) protein